QPCNAIEPEVGFADARARHVEITRLNAKGHVVPEEPQDPRSGLKIELESPAQIGWPDACGRHPGATIQKGNPAGPRRKVVAQVRRKADDPTIGVHVRMELHASEELQPPFEITAIPVIRPLDTT